MPGCSSAGQLQVSTKPPSTRFPACSRPPPPGPTAGDRPPDDVSPSTSEPSAASPDGYGAPQGDRARRGSFDHPVIEGFWRVHRWRQVVDNLTGSDACIEIRSIFGIPYKQGPSGPETVGSTV